MVRQGDVGGTPISPNSGQLFTIGALGIDPQDFPDSAFAAFDILTTGTILSPVNTGYAALTTNGTSSAFYEIDLTTGAAIPVGAGPIGGTTPLLLRAMSIVPEFPQMPTLYTISGGTNLVRFNAGNPNTIISSTPITGLIGGDTILGIDFRPATGQLYGLGSGSRLYTINTATGSATQVGSDGAFTLNGASFGFDFNPAADRIRVVSDNQQNLRLNPDNGTLDDRFASPLPVAWTVIRLLA